MSLVAFAMEYYPYVFHPSVMVGGGIALLIYVEWRREGSDRGLLEKRLGLLVALGALSFVPTGLFMLVTGQGPFETMQGNAWQVDFLVGSGMLLVAGGAWFAWRHYDWPRIVPSAMEALAAVTVPYLLLSPVWNVSGHVVFALMPTLYLALVDRRFWPLLVVPAIMLPNRLYLEAHTWSQTVGAALMTAVFVVTVYYRRLDGDAHARTDATPQ